MQLVVEVFNNIGKVNKEKESHFDFISLGIQNEISDLTYEHCSTIALPVSDSLGTVHHSNCTIEPAVVMPILIPFVLHENL